VFLDELTAGLDPGARHATWDLIAQIRDSGVTVVLARRQVLVADLRIEGRSLDSAYVALTGRSMES